MARTYSLPTMRPARVGRGHSHAGRIGAQPVSSTGSATAVKVARPTPAWSTSLPSHEDWTEAWAVIPARKTASSQWSVGAPAATADFRRAQRARP